MKSSLSELEQAGIGTLIGQDAHFHGVSIDSRTIQPGNLFLAISGPRFDGHQFCDEAINKGASALVIDKSVTLDKPAMVVEDTHLALQSMAAHWRNKFSLKVVAVTGSSGKTTVKEMIAAILSRQGDTLSTQGNLNNGIGVPLTLLRLKKRHRYAVIEIGADHAGEIESIVSLVKPGVALITMIGPSHLEGFGSLDGVAQAKAEIFSALSADGFAIVNHDDNYFEELAASAGSRNVISFGFHPDSSVRGIVEDGRFYIEIESRRVALDIKLLGHHNRINALCAAAACHACGLNLESIQKGLLEVKPVSGRLQWRDDIPDYSLIDDTYNANPASVKAAIDVLVEQGKGACLVLGDMGELGNESETLHRDIGEYARKAGIQYVLCVGHLVKNTVEGFGSDNAEHFSSMRDLVKRFIELVPRNSKVLVKGSRASKMEDFFARLKATTNVPDNSGGASR